MMKNQDGRLFFPLNYPYTRSLIEATGTEDTEATCEIKLYPHPSGFAHSPNMPALQKLHSLFGRSGPSTHWLCGSLKTGERLLNKSVHNQKLALIRPWVFQDTPEPPDWTQTRWGQYLGTVWRNRGIYERRSHARYQQAWQNAVTELQKHYQNQFGWSEDQAISIAEHAIFNSMNSQYNISSYWDQANGNFLHSYWDKRTAEQRKRDTALLDGKLPDQLIRAMGESGLQGSLAMALEHPELVTKLIELGADIDEPNHFGKTPLMVAAQFNLIESARLLIEAGANLEARILPNVQQCDLSIMRGNRSALIYAAEYASPDFITLLIDNGADGSAKDTLGNGVDFYLNRNSSLTGAERTQLRSLLPSDDAQRTNPAP
ncbi:MAG: hypothetical protein Alpg2KO_13210 [Alphaproteobacteria bacterium]